mmetsp:Transcript_10844/g.42066  ORF Transcript_10844/g.42066 Transcript_10844/m.42066 type:complete len:228 (-) Transcript_10844:314-997(-)
MWAGLVAERSGVVALRPALRRWDALACTWPAPAPEPERARCPSDAALLRRDAACEPLNCPRYSRTRESVSGGTCRRGSTGPAPGSGSSSSGAQSPGLASMSDPPTRPTIETCLWASWAAETAAPAFRRCRPALGIGGCCCRCCGWLRSEAPASVCLGMTRGPGDCSRRCCPELRSAKPCACSTASSAGCGVRDAAAARPASARGCPPAHTTVPPRSAVPAESMPPMA